MKRFRCEGCGESIPEEEVLTFYGSLAHEYPAEDGEPMPCGEVKELKGGLMPDLSDPAVIEDIFTYHKPEGDQPAKYEAIRNAAKDFAKVLVANTPKCADQSAAVRLLREAVMTANAAIALKGSV